MQVRTQISLVTLPGFIIAALILVLDAVLHILGHKTVVYDQAVPTIVALYLGGQVGVQAGTYHLFNGSNNTNSNNKRGGPDG